jgi:hypothetical protein
MDPWVSQHLTGSFTCVVTSITDVSKIFEVLGVEPDLDRLHGVAELQDGTSSDEALVGVNITSGSAWCFLADVMGIGLARVSELSQGGTAVCMSGNEHSVSPEQPGCSKEARFALRGSVWREASSDTPFYIPRLEGIPLLPVAFARGRPDLGHISTLR